jgi:3-methyl-2-oxobutanoate hydroxymethyltransferase
MSISITTLHDYKARKEPFAVCTAYDATFAFETSSAGIEVLLVGDSLGMVLQGHDSTLPVSIDEMTYHTRCVSRGNQGALIMADMPFMTYGSTDACLNNAMLLMQAGAHMVKLEGGAWLAESIESLTRQGVPVCAHLGLTPQSVNKLGGYKVQGKSDQQADRIVADAKALEAAGADLILVECVPTRLGKRLTEDLRVPVIGIGAGNFTDAQVLVLHDMLGIGKGKRPKFVKNFMLDAGDIQGALKAYVAAVKSRSFPSEEHSFNL